MPLSNGSGFLLNSIGAEHAALTALRVEGVCTASKLHRCLSEDCLELRGIYAVRVHQCRYDWLRQKLFKRRLAPTRRSPIPDVSTPTQSEEKLGASGVNVPSIVLTPPALGPPRQVSLQSFPKFLLVSATTSPNGSDKVIEPVSSNSGILMAVTNHGTEIDPIRPGEA